jgi:Mg-chelatase subunit ChlD/catechol 2,3-dioxygenase-like lactoylglutathione lyase family enzyme
MSFLNPLFLFGLLAAAVPILIHLLTRKRPREVPFPSVEFLREVNQSEIRRLKLKQWLLLLLRVLAVATLALAMSRPALKGTAGSLAGRAGSTVVVLLDRSASMSAYGTRGTVFSEARRLAEDLLATLGPDDEILLVPYDAGPAPLTPRPTSDAGRVRAALQAMEPGERVGDHAAALQEAARALGESHALNRELFWISDFQATGWEAGSEARAPGTVWEHARAYLLPVAPRGRSNVALVDAGLSPAEEGTALAVTARAFSATAGDLTVVARDAAGNAELGRGYLPLPDDGEATAMLPLASLPAVGGTVEIPDDNLPLDNQRAFTAGPAGSARAVVREEGGPSPLSLALAAGAPASGIGASRAEAAELSAQLADADVLVLNDLVRLGAAEVQAALDFYRGGGALLVVLGPRADADFWNQSFLPVLGDVRLGEPETAAPGAAWRLLRSTAGHAALAGFPARPGEPISAARFSSIRRLAAGVGTRTLLEFDRAHPALVELPRALVFGAGLGPDVSDFPTSGAFLPLLHQAVKALGRGAGAASLVPGQSFSAPAAVGPGDWRVEDPEGRPVPSDLVAAAGATRLQTGPLERTGLYTVLRGGRVVTSFAVNVDPRESDPRPLDDAVLAAAFPRGRVQVWRGVGDLARRVREARFGRELWKPFLGAALLFLVLESVVARWGMEGTERKRRTA